MEAFIVRDSESGARQVVTKKWGANLADPRECSSIFVDRSKSLYTSAKSMYLNLAVAVHWKPGPPRLP